MTVERYVVVASASVVSHHLLVVEGVLVLSLKLEVGLVVFHHSYHPSVVLHFRQHVYVEVVVELGLF